MMNTRYRFGFPTVLLHWLAFFLIAGLIASGKYSDSLSRTEKIPELIATHKQIGVAVLLLMLLRLLWRLINPSPLPLSESALTRLLSFFSHWLLYLAVLAQATGGIIMAQLTSNHPVVLLGWKIPILVGDKGIFGAVPFIMDNMDQLRQWHEYGAHTIIALVGIHVLAALVHHFYFADDTLRRMWFGYNPGFTRTSAAKKYY